MASLRLPTLKQLERMGHDAWAVLDDIERQLKSVIQQTWYSEPQRGNLLARLRRLEKRRDELQELYKSFPHA